MPGRPTSSRTTARAADLAPPRLGVGEPVAPPSARTSRRRPSRPGPRRGAPRRAARRGAGRRAGGQQGVRGPRGAPCGRRPAVPARADGAPGRAAWTSAGNSTAEASGTSPRRRGATGGTRCRGACEDERMTRAQLDKKPVDVAAMFDTVAEKYDVTNDVLSLGPGPAVAPGRRQGRRRPAGGARPRHRRGHRHVAASRGRTRRSRSCPPTSRSACCGSASRRRPDLAFTAADAMRLPFADETFDVVTMSFGLRNVADPDAGAARVPPGHQAGRPAGGLRVQPAGQRAPFRTVYSNYLMRALPPVARRASQQPRLLRLPRRVDPGLADAGASWPRGIADGRLAAGRLAQPDRRHRRAAPRDQALTAYDRLCMPSCHGPPATRGLSTWRQRPHVA